MSVYLKAIEVLEERGWYQGNFEADDGRVCVLGALGLARGESVVLWSDVDLDPVAVALTEIAGRPRSVPVWQDEPGRTVDDVKALLRRAHELSEAS